MTHIFRNCSTNLIGDKYSDFISFYIDKLIRLINLTWMSILHIVLILEIILVKTNYLFEKIDYISHLKTFECLQ